MGKEYNNHAVISISLAVPYRMDLSLTAWGEAENDVEVENDIKEKANLEIPVWVTI